MFSKTMTFELFLLLLSLAECLPLSLGWAQEVPVAVATASIADPSLTFEYYRDDFLASLQRAGKTLVLVVAGWSEEKLVQNPTSSQREQRRAFAPIYLLIHKIAAKGGMVKIFYLTTTSISPAYRQYLHTLATGDDSSTGWEKFEQGRLEILRFTPTNTKKVVVKIGKGAMPLDRPKKSLEEEGSSYLFLGENRAPYRQLQQKIAELKKDKSQMLLGMSVYIAGNFHQKWARELGIPLLSSPPQLAAWDSKSGSRQIFKAAGVPHPEGSYEALKDLPPLAEVSFNLLSKISRPKILLKLDQSSGGKGNVLLDFSDRDFSEGTASSQQKRILERLQSLPEKFRQKIAQGGAIVEEFLVGDKKHSPAAMFVIDHGGKGRILEMHQQLLNEEEEGSLSYCGARGPYFWPKGIEMAQTAVEHLAQKGVRGQGSIDFVRCHRAGNWKDFAVENNLRHGGTTFPFQIFMSLQEGPFDGTQPFFCSKDFHIARVADASIRKQYLQDLFAWMAHHPDSYQSGRSGGHIVSNDQSEKGLLSLVLINIPEKEQQMLLENLQREVQDFSSTLKYLQERKK